MNIISIDLPWNPNKKEHRALAIADLDRNVKIMLANDDNELLELVRDNTEPQSLVLLDVPIDGCDNLSGKHFRPVDRAISKQTLPTLPASKAGSRGKKLKELLEEDKKRFKVYETYPYAVYKFLAYLKSRNLLQCLSLDKFDTLLDDGFRAYWPPKYKREKKREKRLENVKYLYSLLTDTDIGLNFRMPLHHPDASYTLNGLSELYDEYDACLGTIVGLYFINNSSYACIAGDSKSGNILILADQWLVERLRSEIPVYRRGEKG